MQVFTSMQRNAGTYCMVSTALHGDGFTPTTPPILSHILPLLAAALVAALVVVVLSFLT